FGCNFFLFLWWLLFVFFATPVLSMLFVWLLLVSGFMAFFGWLLRYPFVSILVCFLLSFRWLRSLLFLFSRVFFRFTFFTWIDFFIQLSLCCICYRRHMVRYFYIHLFQMLNNGFT